MSTTVILERSFDPPRTLDTTLAAIRDSGGCFELYRVDWRASFLASDGRAMVCWFDAPDTESARTAVRRSGADASTIWNASVHEAPDAPEANVIVARSFAAPVSFEDIQAAESASARCLETHRVRFARTFMSRDGRRMLCFYVAPDAEAVRVAQREAGLPFDAVWPFRRIAPETLTAAP